MTKGELYEVKIHFHCLVMPCFHNYVVPDYGTVWEAKGQSKRKSREEG